MARRIVSGVGQLLLAVAGFLLVVGWFVLTMIEAYNLPYSDAPVLSYSRLGEIGGSIFAASWCWSLITSLDLLRQAKADPPPEVSTPPRITKPPAEK